MLGPVEALFWRLFFLGSNKLRFRKTEVRPPTPEPFWQKKYATAIGPI